MSGTQGGLIQIEYGFASSGSLDYLKVWSSVSRGHWLLACAYWMSASIFHDAGIHFENGYQSDGLAHVLDFAMQHQTLFTLPRNLGRQGLLQIPIPTQEESAAATESVREAFARLESHKPDPVLA
jgi:hypothetical protein